MPAIQKNNKGFHGEEQLSRVKHTAALRRLEKRRDEAAQVSAAWPVGPAAQVSDIPPLPISPSPEPAADSAEPRLRVVTRQKSLLITEQTLEYKAGPGRPVIQAVLRLSTAVKGQRQADGVTQAGYWLRLEIVRLSEGVRLAGFSLGPWQAEKLNLEKGSIALPDPVWSAFRPRTGKIAGRVLLADGARQRLLDLPWHTEGIVPGPEPFPG
jgi:hypothetical protein